jgi:hypothetical protein
VSFSPFYFGSERSSSVRATSLDFSHRPVGLLPVVISFSHPKVLASGFSLGVKNPFCCSRLFLPVVIPQRNRIPIRSQFHFLFSVFGSQRCLLASGLCFATEEIAARRSYCQILIFKLPFCSPARRWMSFFPTKRSYLSQPHFPHRDPCSA